MTRRRIGPALAYVLLTAVAVASLVPFVWLVRSALMRQEQLFVFPVEWIPDPVVWQNFADAMTQQPFDRYFLNTLLLVALIVPGMLFSTSAAAFAFSRLSWPGRDAVFGLLMTGLMLPYAVTIIPVFIGWQNLQQIDTYTPLALPAWFAAGGAFYIFMLRQFFLTIPTDLDSAVYVDGGSPMTVYRHVILPLNKGPLTLVAIFTVIGTWNDLLNPLIYLSTSEKFTVSLGLASFTGLFVSQWALLMAAATIVILPVVILFAFGQRYLVDGIALTGVKG
jgi:multiple sugar transport system permease protein